MDISLFSLLFYYVIVKDLLIVQYKIRKIRENEVVFPQVRSSEAQKGKKRSSLTLSAFFVSCCAQQLFELIQQFRIIEKFRENEAVLAQLRSRKHKKDFLFLHLMFLVVLNNSLN